MIVTRLEALSKGRYKVYIDQEFSFVLYKRELEKYKLSEGGKITEKDREEILQQLLPKRAKLRAMNLLQKRQYTRRQLADKLQEGLYPEKVVDEAIAYVESFRYLDDLQYAVDYITYHETSKTERKMTYDLLQKGISAETIKQAFDQWRASGGIQDETDMILAILEKKHYDPACEPKEKQKFYAYLLRKGFSMENVNKVLGRFDTFA